MPPPCFVKLLSMKCLYVEILTIEPTLIFFFFCPGSNSGPCIYYALSVPADVSSGGTNPHSSIIK